MDFVIELWLVFAIIAALFFIAEMFTTDFTAFVIGAGFAGGAVGLALGAPMWLAIALTGALAYALFRFARPLIRERVEGKAPGVLVGPERLIGLTATTTSHDRVIIEAMGNEVWSARFVDKEAMLPGQAVTIVEVQGPYLLVEPKKDS